MNLSTSGLPVHHQLLEFTQTHVYRVGDAIQPSHPLFSSCPQSLPASESFPMSQLFTWSGQSTGVSASASVLPMNTQDWSPLGWTGWISLQSKGPTRVFSSTTVQKHQFKKKGKHQFFGNSAFFMVQLSHPYMTTGKTIALTRQTFVGKVMSLGANIYLFLPFFPPSWILHLWQDDLVFHTQFRAFQHCALANSVASALNSLETTSANPTHLSKTRQTFWWPPRRWDLSLSGASQRFIWPSMPVLCMEAAVFSLFWIHQLWYPSPLYILLAPSTVPSAWDMNNAIHACWIRDWSSSMCLCQSWGWIGKWAAPPSEFLKFHFFQRGL